MSILKKLASDTAIYGIPSIVGRFIGFLLVFIYTDFNATIFSAHTVFYAYSAFFLVLLPHGMETGFFNFLRKGNEVNKTFTTALVSVSALALLFLILAIFSKQGISSFMNYPAHSEYVVWFAFILFFDVICMMPYALLRQLGKARRFAFIRSVNILINVGLNVLFFIILPKQGIDHIPYLYNSNIGIGYAFIANLVASGASFIMLLPDIKRYWGDFDKKLWLQMLQYGAPLILVGLAGIINETFDRVIMDKLLQTPNPKYDLGVYGAFYKLSIIITIFIQAFRYAAEPFFFERSQDKNAAEVYAKVMNYFVLVCLTTGLLTLFFMNVIAPLAVRDPSYYLHPDGLKIVAPLILANIFLGITYNLSIWYKVKEKNHLGATISIIGAVLTISLLFVFLPTHGFLAAAYITLFTYFVMMLLSYFVGQKYYPIPYDAGKILLLFGMVFILYFLDKMYLQNITLMTVLLKLVFTLGFLTFGYLLINRSKNINLPSK